MTGRFIRSRTKSEDENLVSQKYEVIDLVSMTGIIREKLMLFF